MKFVAYFTILLGVFLALVTNAEPRPYILWDGHRFARTADDHERDVRYFRDLGFTHTLFSVPMDAKHAKATAKKLQPAFAACQKHGLVAGLRFGWEPEVIGDLERPGLALPAGKSNMALSFNPIHPIVIDAFRVAVDDALTSYRQADRGDVIRLFMIGSERTWDLPKENKLSAEARDAILNAAKADGVWKSGMNWKQLGGWWSGPRGKGRDWRVRKAMAEAIQKQIPDARFMIDPLWAAKLPGENDLGANWAYIGKTALAEGVADSAIRVQAACWPNPISQSTQLIRGAHHDLILIANFMTLCIGADTLYHWGVHTFEPGRRGHPWYRQKKPTRSPVGYPRFSVKGKEGHPPTVADWNVLLTRIEEGRAKPWGKRLWAALPDAAQEAADAMAVQLDDEPNDVEPELAEAIVAGLNAALDNPELFANTNGLAKSSPRATALSERIQQGVHWPGDSIERNRILLEQVLKEGLNPTSSPSETELIERVDNIRQQKEPALRSTGKFIHARGHLLNSPTTPEIALVDGVFGPADIRLALLAAHIPYTLMRTTEHRQEALPKVKFILVVKPKVSPELHALLTKATSNGAVVFLPKGYDGHPLTGAKTWDPAAMGKRVTGYKGLSFGGSYAEFRAHIQGNAKRLRQLLTDAGWQPHVDSESRDIVMRTFDWQGKKLLFVVNNRREDSAHKGAENPVEISVRDAAANTQVVRLDNGEQLPIERSSDRLRFRATIPASWYGLYLIGGPDGKRPAPLPTAPKLSKANASRTAGGVQLNWAFAVDDWVGAEVQWLRIIRKMADGSERSQDIYARDIQGPGGFVTQHLDRQAEGVVGYQLQAISPLRIPGPRSAEIRLQK